MVFYRKYRPQTISELDIESVRDRLTSILKSKDIPHAFLFTGPKGLGKTSSARILAKAVNCEDRKKDSIEPCNNCEMCVSITSGSNIDVIEIDAASNRGVDEMRELRERVKYSPAKAQKKIYIIDEVHMLTNEAFNALLKTLEEPPSHVLFILCTTELQKVPSTIVSRTFQVHFDYPTKDETVRSIQRILDGEGLKADDATVETIYKRAGGSFRDAAKIVEELSISSGEKILTVDLLEKVYSLTTVSDGVERLLLALSKKDPDEGLRVLLDFGQKGIDFKTITELLLERLRELLIDHVSGKKGVLAFSSQDLELLINKVSESYGRLKISPIPSLPLELVVARWGVRDESVIEVPVSEKKREIETPEKVPVLEEKSEAVKAQPSQDKAPKVSEKEEERSTTQDPKPSEEEHGELFESIEKNFYNALLQAVKLDNHSIVGVLRGCKLISFNEDRVIFETKFKFHKDKLSEPKVRDVIEKRASEILHKKMTLEVVLKS